MLTDIMRTMPKTTSAVRGPAPQDSEYYLRRAQTWFDEKRHPESADQKHTELRAFLQSVKRTSGAGAYVDADYVVKGLRNQSTTARATEGWGHQLEPLLLLDPFQAVQGRKWWSQTASHWQGEGAQWGSIHGKAPDSNRHYGENCAMHGSTGRASKQLNTSAATKVPRTSGSDAAGDKHARDSRCRTVGGKRGQHRSMAALDFGGDTQAMACRRCHGKSQPRRRHSGRSQLLGQAAAEGTWEPQPGLLQRDPLCTPCSMHCLGASRVPHQAAWSSDHLAGASQQVASLL